MNQIDKFPISIIEYNPWNSSLIAVAKNLVLSVLDTSGDKVLVSKITAHDQPISSIKWSDAISSNEVEDAMDTGETSDSLVTASLDGKIKIFSLIDHALKVDRSVNIDDISLKRPLFGAQISPYGLFSVFLSRSSFLPLPRPLFLFYLLL